MIIELSEQEATALLELTNIALKHDTLGGWAVFNVAGMLRQKLQTAAQKELNEKLTPPIAVMPPVSDASAQ